MKTKLYLSLLIFFLLAGSIITTNQSLLDKTCSSDSNCDPPYIICSENICQHKTLFPIQWKEIIGIICTVLILMIATIGGIGGGSFLVPINLLFFDFDVKGAVALSNGLIIFNSTVKYVGSLFRKNPDLKWKTLVDYNAILAFGFLVPGSLIGAAVGEMLPSIIQITILVCILIFSTYRGLIKSIQVYKRESAAKKKKVAVQPGKNENKEKAEIADKNELNNNNHNQTEKTGKF